MSEILKLDVNETKYVVKPALSSVCDTESKHRTFSTDMSYSKNFNKGFERIWIQ